MPGTLIPGTRLGPYEILSSLGEGGMGAVYRARDTKLNREVAIKVLLPAVANDPDRLARFQREAQVLASLNHPNIAAIYGLEEGQVGLAGQAQTPTRALVMELVEGPTVADMLASGSRLAPDMALQRDSGAGPKPGARSRTPGGLAVGESLAIARQIAEALEAAHEQGIIHRDLKPANIKVRPDGTVKVLDFGLAKALGPAEAGHYVPTGVPGDRGVRLQPDLSQSPTVTSPAMMTGVGMILGTAAYMSPEQARGSAVDKRADLWAFGVVLYEMLTGKRPFEGATVSDTIASVLKTDPNWAALPPDTPPAIRKLLRRCLEKERKQRLADAADARLEIDDALRTPSSIENATAQLGSAPRSAWTRALPWAVAGTLGVALVAAVLSWAPWRAKEPVDRPLVRLDVDLGADVSLPAPTNVGSSIAISPDGTRLAFASGTPPTLFTRRLDQPKATELPGTEGATAPFFSPDGQWIGFVGGSGLKKISVDGGAAIPLGNLAALGGASWSEDNGIFVSRIAARALLRIPADGGPPEAVAEPASAELGLVHPEILPGGKAMLLTVDMPGPVDGNTIEVLTLADHRRKIVVRGGASPRYLPTSKGAGHLVYVNGATLFAVAFDLDTLTTRGTAVPMLDDIAYESQIGAGQFAVSRTGTLVYRRTRGGASAEKVLQWVDLAGRTEPLRATLGVYQRPRLSPDGKRIAMVVSSAGGGQDVWVYDPQRDAMTRLTSGGVNDYPTWSPDGRYVAFEKPSDGIFIVRADGAGQPQVLTQGRIQYPSSFHPDGKRLAYSEGSQLWTVPLEEQPSQLTAGKPEQFLNSSSNDTAPSFSPDGRWLAYQSNESGRVETFVRPFPPPLSGQGGKWQVSNGGGSAPRWSKNGDVVYRAGDQIMAAHYSVNGDTFVPEKPRVWIAKLGGTEWDLAPDGTRVAVLRPLESADAPTQDHEIVFLQNFFDELRRRVPAK